MSRPDGVIVLPPGVTYQQFERLGPNVSPQLAEIYRAYSYGEQLIGGPAKPETGYARYRFDLYGPAGRDWFGVLNAGLLVALIALPIAVVATLSGAL